MTYPSLYEIPIEDPRNGYFSSLGDLFGEKVVSRAREMMRDATPFRVVVAVSICF